MLYPDLHKCKVSHQAPKKVKFGSKEWTEDQSLHWLQNPASFPISYCSYIKIGLCWSVIVLCARKTELPTFALRRETSKGKTSSKTSDNLLFTSMWQVVSSTVTQPGSLGYKSFSSFIFGLKFQRISICSTEGQSEPRLHVMLRSLPALPQQCQNLPRL